MNKYQIHKLKNGITVIFCHYPNFNSVHFDMNIKVGSRYEPNNMEGISHFVEHLFYKKISNDLSQGDWIKNYAYEDFNAHTHPDRTNFEISVHKNDLETAINLFTKFLTGESFTSHDIKTEKEVIKEEILEDKGEIDYRYKKFDRQKFYRNNSLSLDILGNIKSLNKFSQKDVNNFLSEFYQPSNIILSFAGKVNEKEILDYINKHLKCRRSSNASMNQFKSFNYLGDRIYFTSGRQDQVWFNLYFPWHQKNNPTLNIKREFLLGLLRQYLETYFRNRSFCYVFGVETTIFSDYSDMAIAASFSPRKIVEFYKSLKNRLKQFKKNFSETDLNIAKSNSLKILDLDSDYPKAMMNNLSWNYLTFGSVIELNQQKKIIRSIKLRDVHDLFDELFSNSGTIFVGGRISQKDRDLISKMYKKK